MLLNFSHIEQRIFFNLPIRAEDVKSYTNSKYISGPWVAWWLEPLTPDRKTWVRCPMPPNTLQVHTEYVLVKSVGPKVLWAESRVQGTGEYFPPPPVPWQNCGCKDRWCRHLSSLRGISPN
ncbi:uncharacterized protein TNCV_3518151 [Trichonephila clavipes]|nr:uncharacterized protein TNCV_3518151 [Trichonephila clavipes]